MKKLTCAAALAAFLLVPALGATAAPPEGWHPTLDKGLESAKKSGKPLLLITAWQRTL